MGISIGGLLMTKLFEKSKIVLEFDKILDLLQDHIVSELGKAYSKSVNISTDIKEINNRLDETSEAVNLIVKKSNPPLFGITNIKSLMKRLEMGGSLNAENLLRVSDFLRVSRYLISYFKIDPKDGEYNLLPKLGMNLLAFKEIEDEINNAIISEDEISDNASPKLASIRKQITRKKEAIRDKLNSLITNDSEKKYLQDSIVTMREGRYVVPVKQESKSKIKGLVHDMSSSGQTVYIEPMAVVNLNNELKTLYNEEREEIEKILRQLSEKVGQHSYEIAANQDILVELDFIFGKAKLAIEQGANRPIINDKLYINLKKAKHPLLNVENVVPIDLSLGREFSSLIITGPNTGGKTVSIKTVGLLTLMSQYGLHIPADESSEIGIFENVLADIGDEQSIEQSLSTFSSHMINIVKILEEASPRSLVIFDELGAGTDPTEGAALARAIMENMLSKEIRTLATTHYNQLKIYALTVDKVANASMEFNVDTLSPTYKLLIGVPGKSNAFEISKRLGLSDLIIDQARELISEENMEFEEVLKSIEEDRTKIEEHEFIANRERQELEEKNRQLEKEINKLKQSREKVIEDAKFEARKLLSKTKENVELVVDEINLIKEELTTEQARRLQQAKELLKDSDKDVAKKVERVKIKKAKNPVKNLKVGDNVRSVSLNAEGVVLELEDSSGNVLVQMGMMKMKLPKNTLELNNKEENTQKVKNRKLMDNKSKYVKSEIDIRGQNYEDARSIIEKYIDDACLSGLKQVRVIHGKGTGVLREKLRKYFKKNKHIKSFQDAPYNEGGNGVTVVELK